MLVYNLDTSLCFQRRLRPGWPPLVLRDCFSTTEMTQGMSIERSEMAPRRRDEQGEKDMIKDMINVIDVTNVMDTIK